MSHFAKIDKNNIVTEVIVAEQDFINTGKVGDSFLWIQTSYNSNFRGKFAEIGSKYDKANDIFISIQPYPSWTLNGDNNWRAPTEKPSITKDDILNGNEYTWNEDNGTWDLS